MEREVTEGKRKKSGATVLSHNKRKHFLELSVAPLAREMPLPHRHPPPPAPGELLADADENDTLLALPWRAACRAASLVAPKACAKRARLTERCGGVWSAMAISL